MANYVRRIYVSLSEASKDICLVVQCLRCRSIIEVSVASDLFLFGVIFRWTSPFQQLENPSSLRLPMRARNPRVIRTTHELSQIFPG